MSFDVKMPLIRPPIEPVNRTNHFKKPVSDIRFSMMGKNVSHSQNADQNIGLCIFK